VRILLPTTLLCWLALVGCGTAPEAPVSRHSALTVGGCACASSGGCSALSFADIPADDIYYVTTFGGGGDNQTMACGGYADGTWAYIADSARFGCGAKLIIAAGGKQCVAHVADCGPNRCVEQAASSSGCASHFPIIDASPFITEYLLGVSSAGWSDKLQVTATLAPAGSTVGCPGFAPTAPADSGPPPAEPDAWSPATTADAEALPSPAEDSTPPRTPDAGPPRQDHRTSGRPDLEPSAMTADPLSAETLTGGCRATPGTHPGSSARPSVLALLALAAFAGHRRSR
jgi:MYXO-CTERM domain-containing protein